MSFITKLWQRIKHGNGFVGKDLQGNRFYEYANNVTEGFGRTRRVVKYYQQSRDDLWHAAHSIRRLPVQWMSWLSHTRSDPPTIQELMADTIRQQRLKENVARIEAREREERVQLLEADVKAENKVPFPQLVDGPASAVTHVSLPGPSKTWAEPEVQRSDRRFATPSKSRWDEVQTGNQELPKPASAPDYQPESWTPRSVRGSGS